MKREYEALSRLVGRNFAVLDDGNSVYLTPKGAVRDQDGKELLPAFPGRAHLYERNLKQGGGASLPDAAPYQQLVTDGEGKAGWEQRLAWKEGGDVVIEWDGNATDPDNAIVPVEGTTLYWVSPIVFNEAQVKAGKLTSSNGYFEPVIDIWGQFMVGDGYIAFPEAVIFTSKDNVAIGDVGAITLPKAGVYFVRAGDVFTSKFETNTETIHPIPAEYLPKPTVFYAKMGNAYLYTDSAYGTKVTNSQLKDAIAANNVRIMYQGEYNIEMLFPVCYVYNESFGSSLIALESGTGNQKSFYTDEYVEEG